ncbi:MAG: radical SAM protein [Acidobacteriaceae bacterium]
MAKTQANSLPLFPELPPPELPGIARMAAGAPEVDQGHLVQFRSLPVRSLLNRVASRRGLRFAWAINPYRGCEFACRYCYARYTHEFMELRDPADFERKIFVKDNAAWLLRQELRQVRPGEEIAIGTATDPYQPIERRLRVTQSILAVLAEQRGLTIGIVTKSALIARDLRYLCEIARSNELTIHMTITTPDVELARLLEPRAPRPDIRFATVRRLREAGLRVGVMCSPLLPGLTDTGPALNRMAELSRQARACFLYANPLFLKPCSKETYMAFIREHFPALEPMYRTRYESAAFVPTAYAQRCRELLRAACKKHGLGQRTDDTLYASKLPLSMRNAETQLFPVSALAAVPRKPPQSEPANFRPA